MLIRSARLADFAHLETFVWQAIFPAFDRDGLSDEQRAENDAVVENARTEVVSALDRPGYAVFVAIDQPSRRLAGYVIVDARPRAYAEITRLIVSRSFWGKGVAAELMQAATDFIGRDRAVSLAVRHYNERALAFFAKHDFVDTGETAGNHAIPRTLLLREAYADANPPVSDPQARVEPTEPTDDFYDFPSAADEPVFESLPNYNLTIEDVPLFETGQNALTTEDLTELPAEDSHLTEKQLTDLEAFIARARAKKGIEATETDATSVRSQPIPAVTKPQAVPAPEQRQEDARPTFDKSKIEFEIDYGVAEIRDAPSEPAIVEPVRNRASFEFAFGAPADTAAPAKRSRAAEKVASAKANRSGDADATVNPEVIIKQEAPVNTAAPSTKNCPDCRTELPAAARFCYQCGHPQPEPGDGTDGEQAPEDEILLLTDLPEEAVGEGVAFAAEVRTDKSTNARILDSSAGKKAPDATVSLADLKIAFRTHLQDRLLAYFGARKLKKYLRRLEESPAFQQVRDGSLANLGNWLNEQPPAPKGSAAARAAGVRQRNTLADLTEYFIVETAADLHGGILPQRLLRHQSVAWEQADLFRMVMDYLDFDAETEVVYTDFVAMPTRALRNATRSFLQAAKDERVFFICDQSLISQAKNGFALTDSGIYWKNVLQPAGQATFTTLQPPRIEQGHLIVDGQFFDAGSRINLKMALLLDKLRRRPA